MFDDNDWIFEKKYDGYRCLVQIQQGKAELVSRNGLSFNKKYPALVRAFESVKNDMILDGEVVVEDKKGISHFQWLQHLDEEPDRGQLKCYVFDILYFNGFDLTPLNVLQRKKILEALLPASEEIIYSPHTIGEGTKALEDVIKQGGEGLIAKKIASGYHPGTRTKDWLKIKINQEQEMVIGGYTEPQGSRTGFGALLLGYYEDGKLIYSGKVGTGFNETWLRDFHEQLKSMEIKTRPFENKPAERFVHWVKPELVAQVKHSGWTEGGSLRHPVFVVLRTDKKPEEVIREKATGKSENTANMETTNIENKKGVELNFTNTEKLFWPEEKITKGDVIAYYEKMAEYLLPFVVDRPQSLRRNPDGIKNEGFFQKNVEGAVPDWIETKSLRSKSTGETIEYLLCQDKETLLFMANWGCIEINPWSSRVGKINNPDYIIFDLDPNGADIKDLVKTAKKVKEILDQLGITGYLKTSGGKGLHIFIPVLPKYTYDETRSVSHMISEAVHQALPDITSLERSPSKRKGKIYLDFLQNGKGKTMACAYSLRPREGATASTPLAWDELTDQLNVKDFNIRTLPGRVKAKGDIWKNFFGDAMDLKDILQRK